MPRPARRSKSRRKNNYANLREHLLTGNCFPCIVHIDEACTEGELRETWDREKDDLLRAWIRERPGTRPWAFWQYGDDGQPRRRECISGAHPFNNKQRSLHVAQIDNPNFWKRAYSLFWGYPGCILPDFDRGLKYEEDWEYLVRNELLLPEDSP